MTDDVNPPHGPSNLPPPGGWQPPNPQQAPQGGWQPQGSPQQVPGVWQAHQPPQQIVIKQGPGCAKIGLIVLGILFALGILAAGCLALVGNEVAKEIDRSMGEAAAGDYEITDVKCTADDFGLKATGKITNRSDRAQGFHLTIRWETEGGELISEDPVFTDTIKVGQSQAWEANAFKEAPEGATPVCEVSKVEYTIFDNEDE